MIKDCVSYICRHPDYGLTADQLGEIQSLRGEYISYIFSCYYHDYLDAYIDEIRDAAEEESYTRFNPRERYVKKSDVKVTYTKLDSFKIQAFPVIKKREQRYRPIEEAVESYEKQKKSAESVDGDEEASIALWWHDEEYRCYYMQGGLYKGKDSYDESAELIKIPARDYAVFSMKEGNEENLSEELKDLVYYAHTTWWQEHKGTHDELGYSFHCFYEGRAYYCVALLEEEKKEAPDKTYGVETWVEYIDKHLVGNLTITSLAKKFNYSTTHFKRVFRMYYKMSVADYIRKRRLAAIAEEIRLGIDYMETSSSYGFKTYTGFARAFKKEFHVSPAVYSKGMFDVIDLKQYYAQYKDKLRLTIVDMDEIHMIGHTVIPAKGAEVDIPAQVSYWMGREFPCLKDTRFECNIVHREDKIALWYQEEDSGDIEYILGPVVDSIDEDIPAEMIPVTLAAGKYAIFETEKPTDEEHIAETLRMYTRCVFFGWIKECRDRVDLTRLTFERYENGKIYLYVPVKY